ncbi:hypothetical protein A989_02980 [Xanthomonas translucens DAR61454]|nr:hypothetical protein A989_02980 [Xanthomonas translucens DAR61454]
MVVDFVLGGQSLIEHNSDVVSELGDHDYRFSFEFGGEVFRFQRGTADSGTVHVCDENYGIIGVKTVEEFRSFLKAGFRVTLEDISLRGLLGPYIRVWGRGNEDAHYPLHAYKAQSSRECINNLIKTFGLFGTISELQASLAEKEKESSALKNAMTTSILPKVGKREHAKNLMSIDELEHQLEGIKSNLAMYATSIADIVNREMVEQKHKRDGLLEIRARVEASLLRVRRNLANNRHIKSTHFDGLKHYFPEVSQSRLAEVEEFHSEVARLLRVELSDSERSLSERLFEVDEQIAEIDSTISGALKSVSEPTAVLDRVVSLSNSLQAAKEQNRFYELGLALKESIATLKGALSDEKIRALERIQESINDGMRATADAIFGEGRKSPRLSLREASYSFEVYEDTGTGAAFVALILFDLTMFAETQLPVIAHDSLIFKNIENDSVSKLLKFYAQFDKQSFIAIDEADKYGPDAAEFLRVHSVVRLSDDAVLYDKDWRSKSDKPSDRIG